MRNIRLLTILFFIFSSAAGYSQSLGVDAPGVVEVGETFQIVYKASAQPASFNGPDFGRLEVLVGPVSSTMSSTQIINGKRTDSFEVNFTYTLQADAEGKYTIPPASVVIGGKTYSSKSVVIEVVKGDAGSRSNNNSQKNQTSVSDNDIFIRTTVNKSNTVKGEQIVATIKLYTKVAIGGFEDVRFPTFNGFWSQEVDTPQSIEFQRENLDGKIYNAALIKKYVLVPQQTGILTIDPAELVTQVQIRAGSGRSGSMFDDFFDSYQTVRKRLRSAPVRINVQPLPPKAPASFTGGVGNLSFSSSLSKDSVSANEAVSVFVKISGTGNINLIEKPALKLPSEFEIYDVKISDDSKTSGSGISGSKQFEYPFIPRNPGKYTIPGIEFSYYDINSKKYVTVKSKDLELTVGKDASGGSGNNAGYLQPGVNKQAVKNLGSDISYIKRGYYLSSGNTYFLTSIWFYLILAIITGIYFIVRSLLNKRIERKKDVAGMRNRRANKVARARLAKAENMLKMKQFNEFYEELHKALLGYSSDKLLLNMADLSKDKIKENLLNKGVQEELANTFVELIDSCEYARYSPDQGGSEMESNYRKAIELISQLEG
jgi:uncharacterized membrane protein